MHRLARRRPLVECSFFAVIGLFAAGCGDLKSYPGTASDVDPSTPGLTTAASDRAGPGAHGSLPSGYCCTADSDCRDRHCAEPVPGGGRMCLDACHQRSKCERPDLSFTCVQPAPGEAGWCEPAGAAVACIPQAKFQRGTRQVGECCADTNDGTSGEECEGNKCLSSGVNDVDGPYVCSQRCETTKDCPSGTVCGPWNTCDPGNFPYTCK